MDNGECVRRVGVKGAPPITSLSWSKVHTYHHLDLRPFLANVSWKMSVVVPSVTNHNDISTTLTTTSRQSEHVYVCVQGWLAWSSGGVVSVWDSLHWRKKCELKGHEDR